MVQLYIRDITSERVRPLKELRNFTRVYLKPSESKMVKLEVGKQQLEYWNNGEWVVEPGKFEIMVGVNSEKLKKTILEVSEM